MRQNFENLQQPLAAVLFYEVIYPSVYRRAPKEVKYSLFPPDAWLLALAAVMWEGIVQGLAWDAVKATGQRLIASLRENGLAPSAVGGVPLREETGFRYTSYAASGRKKREIFVGLRRVYRGANDARRQEISRSFDVPQPVRRQVPKKLASSKMTKGRKSKRGR